MCFTQLIKIRTSALRKLIINPYDFNDEVKRTRNTNFTIMP